MRYAIDVRVETAMVIGAARAAKVASALVASSAWFMCTPLPDDVYEFAVKQDRHDALSKAVPA